MPMLIARYLKVSFMRRWVMLPFFRDILRSSFNTSFLNFGTISQEIRLRFDHSIFTLTFRASVSSLTSNLSFSRCVSVTRTIASAYAIILSGNLRRPEVQINRTLGIEVPLRSVMPPRSGWPSAPTRTEDSQI